jgi:hypothetical protein
LDSSNNSVAERCEHCSIYIEEEEEEKKEIFFIDENIFI